MAMTHKNNGFTLVEILVVSMILALVSLAVFSTFSNGIKLYKRMTQESGAIDRAIFLDRFTTDLRNSFLFTGLQISGEDDSCSLPTVVYQPALQARSIGMVNYAYDSGSKQLLRTQSDYAQLYAGRQPQVRQSLNGVSGARFSYYRKDPEKNVYLWLDEWDVPDEVPLAVRLELTEGSDEDERKIVRTVWLPAADAAVISNTTEDEAPGG
jgi:prepilin-type N-terminal cleavage/methylation domain-containing protein